MYEFIIAGVPMIASQGLINVNKIIEEEGFGITCKLEVPQDYADAISQLFDAKQGGAARFKQNFIDKRQKYFWEHDAKKLTQFYAGLQ